MLRWLVGWSLKSRILMVVVAAALILAGIAQFRQMPVDVLPEFASPYVEIQTESLGLSAQEVEQLITVPMEQDLLIGVPWVETIRSESVSGLSSIVLYFKPGTDLMRARQMVAERMTQAVALPHVSKPPVMLQTLSATSRLMMVGLSSKDLSMIQMSVLARWTIGPRLMGVPGVANVAIWGFRDRQLQVQIDPQRLRANRVTMSDILETTGNALWVSSLSFVEASTPGTGGFIDTANQRLGILHVSPISSAEGLAQIPIADEKKSDGTPLRLTDVANVVEDHQPLIGDAAVNEGPGLVLVIEKFPGANTLQVTRGVEAALDAMRPGMPGISVNTTIYRPASFLESALGNLQWALFLGFALVVLALGALYWSWRIALISAITIPLSLIAAALVLYLRGATMNVIAIAGLLTAVGVVVDDAIVGVENAARQLREKRRAGSDRSAISIILEATLDVRVAITYATLITLLAVLPVFFVQGASGAFFQPLAIAYGLAVLASMVVTTMVTPALCLLLLSKEPIEGRGARLAQKLRRGYEGMLARTVRRPRLALVMLVGVLLAGLAIVPFLGLSLTPSFKERDLLIRLNAAPGTSQPEMTRVAGLVSRELRSIPGVSDVGANIGRAVLGDQIVNVNSAELWVSVEPSADYDRSVVAIREVVDGYPGLHGDVQTYLKERSNNVATIKGDPIVVRVFGPDLDTLHGEAARVSEALAGIGGIEDARVNLPTEEANLQIQVDLAAAQSRGLAPGDVRRAAATALSGIQVGSLFEEQKVFDVVVWSTPETRHSPSSIGELMIDTPNGGQVRLGDVAKVSMVPAPSVIKHEAVSRYLDVSANVRDRDIGTVVAEVKTRLQQVQFRLEYHAEVLGDTAAEQGNQTRAVGLAVAILIGVLLLLQAAFGSWRLALLSLSIVPTALVGGLLAVSVAGGIVTLGSLLGFLVVLGITMRNSVVLITHYQHLQSSENTEFGSDLALRGAAERLTPTLFTVVAASLALMPALFMGDVPGLEIARPMAVVIIGGLVTSTFVNLLTVPALYLRLAVRRAAELELAPVAETV